MVYVLEFFALGPHGERDILDDLKCRAATLENAAEQARAVGRNVRMRDRQANLCVIKDQKGRVFTVVGLLAA
jgi:hypothetical protein